MCNKNKSLFLSRILTGVCAWLGFIFALLIPDGVIWYNSVSEKLGILAEQNITIPMLITLYFSVAMAYIVLWSLHKLLKNISKEKVFIPENTGCLRSISWACMLAGISMGIFSLWRSLFVFFAFVLIFMALVMRVVKNVFENAVEIKSENDFTI